MRKGLTDIAYYEMADIYSKIQATVRNLFLFFITEESQKFKSQKSEGSLNLKHKKNK